MTAADPIQPLAAALAQALAPELARALGELVRDATARRPVALTQGDLASVFQVSRGVVAEWVRAGMPTLRCGAQSPRYELEAVLAWLRERDRGQEAP
jgi:hypothetical protein